MRMWLLLLLRQTELYAIAGTPFLSGAGVDVQVDHGAAIHNISLFLFVFI